MIKIYQTLIDLRVPLSYFFFSVGFAFRICSNVIVVRHREAIIEQITFPP